MAELIRLKIYHDMYRAHHYIIFCILFKLLNKRSEPRKENLLKDIVKNGTFTSIKFKHRRSHVP